MGAAAKKESLLAFLSSKDELHFCHLCKNRIMRVCCRSTPLHLLVVLTLLPWSRISVKSASTSELPGSFMTHMIVTAYCLLIFEKKLKKRGTGLERS